MPIRNLLARGGLAPRLRVLVGVAAAVWRGQWPVLGDWLRAGQQLGQPRADVEETLLQAVLFCGFPRVVTAFDHLANVWPALAPPAGGALPAAAQARAGRALFAAIYGDNAAAVEAMLESFHGDFHAFVLEAAYGRILTRPHLPAGEREVLAVALLAVQAQPRQFAGHARGALRCGARRDELCEALWTAFEGGPEAAVWIDRLP
jgi:alkylhydroperoxidase/carboxymuconolactone decarboxylase family protein YurZ